MPVKYGKKKDKFVFEMLSEDLKNTVSSVTFQPSCYLSQIFMMFAFCSIIILSFYQLVIK